MNILRLIILVFYSAFSVAQEPVKAVPAVTYDKQKAALGEKLFFDVRLSKDDSLSCNSCHDLDKGGVDHRATSIGINDQVNSRNVPTVYNTVFNFQQLWDGSAETLEQQAEKVVINPKEMGMPSWEATVEKIGAIDFYQQQFDRIYQQPVSKALIIDALVEFERSLVSINAPFDQYLKGDEDAISDKAKEGYALFKSYGCVKCHQGINLGGNMFKRAGTLHDLDARDKGDTDLGRYHITGNEWDKRVFKVPGLRLVTKTAPYFHDGSVKTLREAIDVMARFQLGKVIPESHKDAMIEFFKSLPGELPKSPDAI